MHKHFQCTLFVVDDYLSESKSPQLAKLLNDCATIYVNHCGCFMLCLYQTLDFKKSMNGLFSNVDYIYLFRLKVAYLFEKLMHTHTHALPFFADSIAKRKYFRNLDKSFSAHIAIQAAF